VQWHFVSKHSDDESIPYRERPYALYFRDDERSFFGVVRIEHWKDIPMNVDRLIQKILNSSDYREKHFEAKAKHVWLRNWK